MRFQTPPALIILLFLATTVTTAQRIGIPKPKPFIPIDPEASIDGGGASFNPDATPAAPSGPVAPSGPAAPATPEAPPDESPTPVANITPTPVENITPTPGPDETPTPAANQIPTTPPDISASTSSGAFSIGSSSAGGVKTAYSSVSALTDAPAGMGSGTSSTSTSVAAPTTSSAAMTGGVGRVASAGAREVVLGAGGVVLAGLVGIM